MQLILVKNKILGVHPVGSYVITSFQNVLVSITKCILLIDLEFEERV